MIEFIISYAAISLGVFISIILPVLKQFIVQPPAKPELYSKGMGDLEPPKSTWFSDFMELAKPYLLTGVFSLIVGLLLLAFLGESITSWQAALLAGYTGDSTLQKLRN